MAIPFYENEEQSQQHQHHSEEVDQVDGPIINPPNIQPPDYLANLTNNESMENQGVLPTAEDLMAWKILAVAMCKALKDHYQQNMSASTASSSSESTTAVIQILPNGQVKPSWN